MIRLVYTTLSPEEVTRRVVAIVGVKPNQNPYVCNYCGQELREYCSGNRVLCLLHGFVRPVYGNLTEEYRSLSPEQRTSMIYGSDDDWITPSDVKARIQIEEDWRKRYNQATKTVIRLERESRGIFEGRDQA